MQEALREYTDRLISETRHIAAIRQHSESDPFEVTVEMVKDAQLLLKRGVGARSTGWGVKIVRICAAVLSLIVGMMYNPTLLQSQGYLFLFIIVMMATLVCVMISVIKE